MQESNTIDHIGLLGMTTEIVVAAINSNSGPPIMIESIIADTYAALAKCGSPAQPEAPAQEPAVPINRSIKPDYIVCLEDGKKLKMLKRHLMTAYNMTPEEYRAKWGLPADYPMTAPNYAEKRRELAKKIGLGRLDNPNRGRKAAA